MSLDFVEAIPSKDRLTQSCCPFHRERLAEGCRPESEKVQALPTRSTTQLRIQSPVSSDTPPLIFIIFSTPYFNRWFPRRQNRSRILRLIEKEIN